MSLAQDLIDDARGFASELLANAQGQMIGGMNALAGVHAFQGNGPAFSITPPTPKDPGDFVPVNKITAFKDPGFRGTVPTWHDPGTLETGGEPGAAPTVPELNLPAQPTGEPLDTTGAPPTINGLPSIPAAPDLLSEIASIPVPVLHPIDIPDAPAYQKPTFMGQRPDAAPVAPTDLEGTLKGAYSDINPIMKEAITASLDEFLDKEFPQFRSGMAAIEDRLATYLQGGTALTADVENAIFNRTMDKTNSEGKKMSADIWGKAARAGFTIPPAILLSQQQDIEQERRNMNARAATEIAIKQAELEQANLQFAVTQSINLRQIAIQASIAYYNGLVSVNGQALEYARSVVDSIVKAYDVAAKHAEIQARTYEADARVYESLLKGAMAELEAYRSTIEGLKAQAEVDTAAVNAYSARVRAVQAEADVYTAQINGFKAQAEIERLKAEIYDITVKAYASKVNAWSAKWEGYKAAVGGESAKMEAAAAQQRAYTSTVAAYEAKLKGRTAALEGKIQANDSAFKAYGVLAQAYSAQVGALAEVTKGEAAALSGEVEAFRAKASASTEFSRSQIAHYEAATRASYQAAMITFQNLKEHNEVELRKAEAYAKVATAAGDVWSAAASASLSGLNSLASVTLQEAA